MNSRDKGKRGKVIRVYPNNNRALVEGINFIVGTVGQFDKFQCLVDAFFERRSSQVI